MLKILAKIIFTLVVIANIYGCATSKQNTISNFKLNNRIYPIKVIAVGYWRANKMLYTLEDANQQRFTVIADKNDNLKIGTVLEK